jgi:signal-transduction protein with cAMP-binding, CBS, and nucleotidyltransferase domain
MQEGPNMKANEIMTKDVLSVDENTSVKEAVQIMAKHNVGALIVQTPKPTFGIFTQGDLVTRVIAEGKDLEKTKIKDVMTETVQCAQAEDKAPVPVRDHLQAKLRGLATDFHAVGAHPA